MNLPFGERSSPFSWNMIDIAQRFERHYSWLGQTNNQSMLRTLSSLDGHGLEGWVFSNPGHSVSLLWGRHFKGQGPV
jgi:hypothetical protein